MVATLHRYDLKEEEEKKKLRVNRPPPCSLYRHNQFCLIYTISYIVSAALSSSSDANKNDDSANQQKYLKPNKKEKEVEPKKKTKKKTNKLKHLTRVQWEFHERVFYTSLKLITTCDLWRLFWSERKIIIIIKKKQQHTTIMWWSLSHLFTNIVEQCSAQLRSGFH